MHKHLLFALIVGAFFVTSSLSAHTDEQRRDELIQKLSGQFDPAWVTDVFNHKGACSGLTTPIERLTGGWPELERRVMTEESIVRGVNFYRQHESAFECTPYTFRDTTGNLPFVMVAILRIESDFGENRTGTPVVELLWEKYRKAADGPPGDATRARVIKHELASFLAMAHQNNWDICEVRGSRAAAFGFPHFIPASLSLAVDGDRDGKIDIMWNIADSAASIGNFLEKRWWRRDPHKAVFYYNNDYRYVRIVMSYATEIKRRVQEEE